jgi:hypothetical protein
MLHYESNIKILLELLSFNSQCSTCAAQIFTISPRLPTSLSTSSRFSVILLGPSLELTLVSHESQPSHSPLTFFIPNNY